MLQAHSLVAGGLVQPCREIFASLQMNDAQVASPDPLLHATPEVAMTANRITEQAERPCPRLAVVVPEGLAADDLDEGPNHNPPQAGQQRRIEEDDLISALDR